MSSIRRIAIALGAMCAVGLGACHHKVKPVVAPPTPTVTTTTTSNADSLARARALADSISRARRIADSIAAVRADEDRRRREAATNTTTAAEAARLRETLMMMVHFDYDKADLRDDARAALDAKVPILRTNADVMMKIAGHTDNRGSDEYNLALSQRRAEAARQYLVDHGVPVSRLETISYGEDRPLCQQEDETCWAQNRRAEFQIAAGGANLKKQ